MPIANRVVTLSIVIPCFNEQATLQECVESVQNIADDDLVLELLIVDDASTDGSLEIAQRLAEQSNNIVVLQHERNRGKGAALRTGFEKATGDFVAVQDADLEYNPEELKDLLVPLRRGEADVVIGSRFLSSGYHRVLYFWHSMGNKFLTLLSNLFTDLNLTDMESCYKVFKREVIQSIDLKEDRFGFEPEIVAKVAHMRLRIYELGISYRGRTYEEGKKVGWRDGVKAIECIVRYNAHHAPLPIQFFIYIFIGGLAALINLGLFLGLSASGMKINVALLSAYFIAGLVNYLLCILLLFRHKARWGTASELVIFLVIVGLLSLVDVVITRGLLGVGIPAVAAKLTASLCGLILNFSARRFIVFPEPSSGPWR